MTLRSPVVFIIFNRPETTKAVFDSIAAARPKRLLIVADGPRIKEDSSECEKARAIIKGVDWNCEVLENFATHNLGCGRRPASGLDWAFSLVDEAIILEDDCIPAPSFFPFCDTLLERFRHDERVMHISGNNFQFGIERTKDSYYFSKYAHIWGWATWRRAWKHFDYQMRTWPEFKKSGMLDLVCEDPDERRYWQGNFDLVYNGREDIWDYQWMYACWSQGGLSITPYSNLVSNVGFGSSATHTHTISPLARLPTKDIWEITHPPSVRRHQAADLFTFDEVFGGKYMKRTRWRRLGLRRIISLLRTRTPWQNR